MTLYLLDHRHWIDAEYYDTKLIGILSSHSYALEVIERYSQLPGFREFKSDFHMESFEIDLNEKMKKRGIIYLITVTQKVDEDEITIAYSLYSNAFIARLMQGIKWVKLHRNNKIYVSKNEIDELDWKEGFVTIE